jgi:hypothetical protein
VLVIVEQFPAVPMSWAVYNHANYATEEFETWWREAHLHSVALRHIVSYPDVQGRPFLLSAGDADEVSTHDALQWVYGVVFFGWSFSLLLEGIIANGELPNQASAVCVCGATFSRCLLPIFPPPDTVSDVSQRCSRDCRHRVQHTERG